MFNFMLYVWLCCYQFDAVVFISCFWAHWALYVGRNIKAWFSFQKGIFAVCLTTHKLLVCYNQTTIAATEWEIKKDCLKGQTCNQHEGSDEFMLTIFWVESFCFSGEKWSRKRDNDTRETQRWIIEIAVNWKRKVSGFFGKQIIKLKTWFLALSIACDKQNCEIIGSCKWSESIDEVIVQA